MPQSFQPLTATSKMRQLLIFLTLVTVSLSAKAQYPFEKFPAPEYEVYNDWKIYDKSDKEQKIHSTLTIPGFFDNKDTLTIQLTSYTEHNWENSIIRIYNNKTLSQKITENMGFNPAGLDTVKVADINGDGLADIKIVTPYFGCGLAALNVRVIYLFQKPEKSFIKISYDDKMSPNRQERDLNGDGNFEIITMNLVGVEDHNYWTFNVFSFNGEDLINVNSSYNYPIMIQYLFRDNYEITKKISREKMKEFALDTPEEYNRK